MHQGQHSSLSNCEVVQRGVKLLRLDCVAVRGSREKERKWRVLHWEKQETEDRDTSGMREGGAVWCCERNRGEKTQSQSRSLLVPVHFILLSFFPLFSASSASHSPLPRWSFGPLVWTRYKAIAHACLPSLWYLFCQNCHCIIFLGLLLFEQKKRKKKTRTSTLERSTALIFWCCTQAKRQGKMIKEGRRGCSWFVFQG